MAETDIFTKFRLPIPLHQQQETLSLPPLPPYCTDEQIYQLLNLLRLLNLIKSQHHDHVDTNKIQSQLNLVQSTLHRIEVQFVPLLNEHRQHVDNMTELELNFHSNIQTLLDELRLETREACIRLEGRLNMQNEAKRDLISEIFLLPEDQSPLLSRDNEDECENDLEFSDGSEDEYAHDMHQPPRQHHQQSQQQLVDPTTLQKQQQHLLEAELSTLATRLKTSTLAMNATLQSQTRELEQFESLAQHNLDSVSSTASRVEERVKAKKGWKKRLATWSLIGFIVGMWIFCFLIMRSVPKRTVRWDDWSLPKLSMPFKKWSVPNWLKNEYIGDDYEDDITDEMYAENERRQWEMLQQKKEEERRRWNEKRERQWQQQQEEWQWQQQQQQQQQQEQQWQQGCEILPDGTQHCPGDSNWRAQQLAAERKRNRIEENMANARVVEAVDVNEAAEEEKRRVGEAERLRLQEEHRRQQEAEKQQRLQQERAEAEAQRAAEEQARLQAQAAAQEAERQHQIKEAARVAAQEQMRLKQEEKARAAEKQWMEEERQRIEEEKKREKEAEVKAAQEKWRQEEAEYRRKVEEEARLKKETEARAAAEREALEKKQQEEAAAAEKERLEREALERQRLAEEAAAAEAERLEHERLAAIQREKENTERVLRTAIDEASAAVELAKEITIDSNDEILPSDIRFVAGRGTNHLLAHYITQQPEMADASDGSGWRPIHEAARGGNLAGLQLLIRSGSDLSARTGRGGTGGTALWWAIQRHGEDSDVVRLLRHYDAPDDGPEL